MHRHNYIFAQRCSFRLSHTTQKMKFSIKDFFRKCDQIRRKLRIWSHLLKKSLMENFISCAVLGSCMLSHIYRETSRDHKQECFFLNMEKLDQHYFICPR